MKIRQGMMLAALCAGLCVPVAAWSNDGMLFDGAVGSTPFGSINNAGTPDDPTDDYPVLNRIHGVAPGGLPWTIRTFKANIRADGRINARGEGLLLSGGNNFGRRGGPRQVLVSLFCPGDTANPFHSEFVDLSPDGDFQIRGFLRDANGGAPPSPCGDNVDNRPTLLIRTVAGPAPGAPGAWFAAAILSR